MTALALSAKSIKNYTSHHLNYELTSNAFDLLNQHIKSSGEARAAADIYEWLMRVLERAKEMGKKVIKRKDMETIILSLTESGGDTMSVSIDENDPVIKNNPVSETDLAVNIGVGSVCDNTHELSDDHKEIPNQNIHDYNEPVSTTIEIEITQLPSMLQSETIRELENEIERLKKIIQIILNKQAELA